MIIYADILFAVNWWINFLLLTGVARMGNVAARVWRVAAGGFIGSLFSVLLFLPSLPAWVTLLAKFLAAAVMIWIAFGWQKQRQFTKAFLLLFGLSAGLAGLCSALYFFIAPSKLYVFNGVVYYAVSPWLLLVLTLICYIILTIIEKASLRRAPHQYVYTIAITYRNRTTHIRCLYDTGNHLTEPFSNRPVLVAERAALNTIIDIPIDSAAIPPNGEWRIIPFNTLGGDGLLPAFVPDKMAVITAKKESVVPSCYVAVCNRLGRGDYQGLLGTALGDYIT